MKIRFALLGACSLAAVAAPAFGQSVVYTTPNQTNTAGATSVTLNGETFVNQGLVGTGRLPATLKDFNGETLGSFSGLAVDLGSWRRNADGSYVATMFTLPDRGPNNVGGLTTTNYASRLNRFSIAFNPYTGSAALAPTQNQLTLTQNGGFLLRDGNGQTFTGRDPQAGTVTRGGIAYPSPPAGDLGAGKIAMDAEAVTFLQDGSFYVGDEYGAMIYYFDATGRQIGGIAPTGAMVPRVGGVINYNGTNDAPLVAGSTGRRSNQGMEGISVSPDGKRLFAVLQSATLQDNPTNVAQRRNNTRVMVYDISATRTPTTPVAEYVLQLPVVNNNGNGAAANVTAAQSEILALNSSQFLVLSRDGNGRGIGTTRPPVFKSVLLVDVNGATNIAGTSYSSGVTPISTTADANGAGALVSGITAVKYVELVNMLNPVQLGRFGMNTSTAPTTQYSLSEKWEAMGLVPVLEEAKPQDFFLLVGNDNDFISSDVDAAGIFDANTALTDPASGTGNNDNVILVYRLTLPTYIDPEALEALEVTGPVALSSARQTAAQFGTTAGVASMQAADSVRRLKMMGEDVSGHRVWAQGYFRRGATPFQNLGAEGISLALGAETGTETTRAGATFAYEDFEDDHPVYGVDGSATSLSVYGVFDPGAGAHVLGAFTVGKTDLDKIARPSSYGMVATGETDADTYALEGEIGWTVKLSDNIHAGPYFNARLVNVDMDGYTEHGAAVGNATFGASDYERLEMALGVEAAQTAKDVTVSGRLAYVFVNEDGDLSTAAALASNAAAQATLTLPAYDDGYVMIGAAIDKKMGAFNWRAGVETRFTDEQASGLLSVGIGRKF